MGWHGDKEEVDGDDDDDDDDSCLSKEHRQ
jgi:hypothetical protein